MQSRILVLAYLGAHTHTHSQTHTHTHTHTQNGTTRVGIFSYALIYWTYVWCNNPFREVAWSSA